MEISISVIVNAPLQIVWDSWVTPEDIIRWNFASDEWCCPKAEIELEPGSIFSYRMEAKDGSMGFDFSGVFTKINPLQLIEYNLSDNRPVRVEFCKTETGIKVTEVFLAEDESSGEQQKQGWLCILNNFKKHTESKKA